VDCFVTETNIFYEVGELSPNEYTWRFVIEDGLIVEFRASSNLQIIERLLVTEYAEWVRVNYPADPELVLGEPVVFAGNQLTILLAESDQRAARHLELTAEWAASRD
jgi:hypothetical protein